ncbi:Protein phosphatase 2C (PP2C)-like protein [Cynara cardunculus var. scolymus]|uniref:Protein phosphatase 2C (PP2C)-like protein n=1 Tax=Cynara cardunculus var. scolymus TaxID=59895 RepID=A0A103XNC5_CYNCS|nr:Protein phosphatase 2C (PP2C)-like protein [Cynara cardunculus var. scolymus]
MAPIPSMEKTMAPRPEIVGWRRRFVGEDDSLEKTMAHTPFDVVSLAQTKDELEAAAKRLTETVFNRRSCDNITCIIVKPNHNPAT